MKLPAVVTRYAESIVDTVREPLLVLDADLRVMTASRSFCRTFHVTPEETQGRLVYDLGNRQWDIPALRKLLEEVLPQDTEFNDYEVEHDFPGIGHRAMLLNARRIYGEGNRNELILLAIEDITDRKRAEQGRREDERRFRRIIEQIKDYAIFLTDLRGRATSWNEGVRRVLGFEEADFIGKDIVTTIFTPEDVRDGVPEQELRTAAETGSGSNDRWMRRKDGTRFFAMGITTAQRDDAGRLVGFTKIMRDQTSHKRIEEKLRESERQLTTEAEAMNSLHELVSRLLVCFDLVTALNEVLDATILLVGADMGNVQLLNSEDGMLEIVVHRGFKQQFLEHFRFVGLDEGTACGRALKGGERVIIEDVQTDAGCVPHLHVAKLEGWHGVQSTPLMSRKGEVLGMISTHYRKPHRPAERDLRILDLYARQAADFIERMRTEEALRESDRRKSEFLAMLAHELRNPLAPIRNALQILRLTGGSGQAVEQASGMMERQVGQMVRLVDDLLDVSRISRGKIELKKGRVELASVVNHAVEAARPSCESRGLQLTVTQPPQPIYLHADPTRLAQVVGNLLSNACKFTEKGGHVRLTVEREGEQAVIRVRDNGIGIAADELPRIFDMFTQVNTTLERSQSGLGIGLTMVKTLAEMHHGTVEAHSAGLGRGSEFVVRLPLAAAPPPPAPEGPSGSEKLVAPRRMLVVDDNRDAAESLAILLKLSGHEVHMAFDGLDAVAAAERLRPDVTLMDIGMPKLNGYEACRRIREQPWGEGMVLVALTGWGQEEDRQKSSEAGFDGHLVKPVELEALQQLLAKCCSAPASS